MAKFEYEAKNAAGVKVTDVLTADSEHAAVDVLHAQGLVVLSVREAKEGVTGRLVSIKALFSGRITDSDLAVASRQLATMVHAGLPLIRSIHALTRDEKNEALAKVLRTVAEDISGGDTMSRALGKHPQVFSHFYVSLVRSGEESGTLDATMLQLAAYLERAESIRRKVKAAMSYPIFVIGFVVLAGLVLFLKVVPMMAKVYDNLDSELPLLTRIVIATSDAIQTNLWVLFVLAGAIFIGFAMLKRSPKGRFFLDKKKLHLPIFGGIVHQLVLAKFMRTLGVLFDSGVPVLSALELSSGSAGNEVIARAVGEIGESVSKGATLSRGFTDAEPFPEIVVQMVSTGEETGTLGNMLKELSDFYDERAETAISGLSSLIEPLLMVFIGGVVAIVVVATFLPIFGLSQVIR